MLLTGVVGFVFIIILLFYILKLFAITLFNIPGFNSLYQYLIIAVPYIIFFCGFYYLNKKISFSKSKASRIAGRILITLGSLICLLAFIFSTLDFASVKNNWVNLFNENTHFILIAELLILITTAGVIAIGDPKEKDWTERHRE
jgi:hypothetical protein